MTSILEEQDSIRQDYMISLEELTSNSRPIITNLTIIAQENIQAATAITRAIEDHIARCAPQAKLPALYLLDSICKNVGSPYTLLFGRNLYKTFTNAYTTVSDPTRRKMHELFHTWILPPANQVSLFPNEQLRKIEIYLSKVRSAIQPAGQWQYGQAYRPEATYDYASLQSEPKGGNYRQDPYGTQSNGYSSYSQPQPLAAQISAPGVAAVGMVTRAGLIEEIGTLVDLTNEKLLENPQDEDGQTQMNALTQLHKIVSSSDLPPVQLSMIKEKLDLLSSELQRQRQRKRKASPELSSAEPAPKRTWNSPQEQNQVWTPPVTTAATIPGIPPAASTASILQPDIFASMAHLLANPQPQTQLLAPIPAPYLSGITELSGAPAPAPASTQPDMLGLLLGSMGASQSAGGRTPTDLFDQLRLAGLIMPTLPAANAIVVQTPDPFAKFRGLQIELTTKFIQKPHDELVALLYDDLPLQCSTCGRRFADTESDRKLHKAHLDWHFRVNKRIRDDMRGQSRSWYLDEEQWIHYTDLDDRQLLEESEKAGGDDNGNRDGTNDGAQKEDASKRYVLAPADAAAAAQPCPNCMEKFKSVWSDQEEAWVWMNAAMGDDGKIYHATCLQDSAVAPTRN
ncbi:uncharacterized protein V1518DRAFT_427727 [Limtongia smithiae]|uniref:uncharacterized protein n=1 Tax=Limtongia smithiae TaxID=1125753 RepID=UPI0034CED4BC